jgi:hypothetical protein
VKQSPTYEETASSGKGGQKSLVRPPTKKHASHCEPIFGEAISHRYAGIASLTKNAHVSYTTNSACAAELLSVTRDFVNAVHPKIRHTDLSPLMVSKD